ncbi:hypothetical protein COO91_00563 [Nostoc flagelliforme CCNUN1]|uniref:Uncharacterized protein n=1 Tax=Nostoc flagelliforme CCNUN1 TaxID=2038116 RepID=A0A2K8SGY8_9NOSO|nr:hypothetical protein COO91_00563 [Nostoc flagelliforme CCNUN1]
MTRLKWRKLVPELVVRPDLLSRYFLCLSTLQWKAIYNNQITAYLL